MSATAAKENYLTALLPPRKKPRANAVGAQVIGASDRCVFKKNRPKAQKDAKWRAIWFDQYKVGHTVDEVVAQEMEAHGRYVHAMIEEMYRSDSPGPQVPALSGVLYESVGESQ